MSRVPLILMPLCLGVVLLLMTDHAEGCAGVGKSEARIAIAQESVILLWDAKTKTQHFIRSVAFNSNVYDFGFLVPTPTQPELKAANQSAFPLMEKLLIPKVIVKRPLFFTPLFSGTLALGSKSDTFGLPNQSDVRILDARRVGGYDAVVLEADSAEALNKWLGEHGYVSRPALVKWLEPLIAARWKITAFKIANDPKTGKPTGTSPIRMSFKTDRPFFPYRETEDAAAIEGKSPSKERLLRIFFLGEKRMQGSIGLKEPREWPGEVKWAGPVKEEILEALPKELALDPSQVDKNLYLTAFEDRSSPRSGSDELFFEPSADQSSVHPQPIIAYDEVGGIIPIDLVLLSMIALLGLFLIGRRILKARV